MLLAELEDFKGRFDILYLPFDYENGGNKGYAFINFINPLHILDFYDKFQNKAWNHFESKKICELNSANFQGRKEIEKHAKNYKGLKKPYFAECGDGNKNILIPSRFLDMVLNTHPSMKYNKENSDTILIQSL